jgi:hypothetical protein
LETITQKNVTNSRQHFLRLNFPTTYRALIQAGITDDFTMGYADAVGFRAGVAVPFQWFDLLENKITTLTIHPFMAMDATLKQYLNLNPAKAAQIVIDLAKATQKYGGQMITLWHNSSFTEEWKGWKEAYISILEGCKNPINRANS